MKKTVSILVRIPKPQHAAMKRYKANTGVPIMAQIRNAITEGLKRK